MQTFHTLFSLSFFSDEIKGPRPPPLPLRQGWQRTRGADAYSRTFRRRSALPAASPLSGPQRLGVAHGREGRGRGAEAQRSREGRPLPLALPPVGPRRWTRGPGLGWTDASVDPRARASPGTCARDLPSLLSRGPGQQPRTPLGRGRGSPVGRDRNEQAPGSRRR